MTERSRATDRQIVAELRRDARQTNVALARRVGLSEGAVRRRVDNLVASGAIRFTVEAVSDLLGFGVRALLRIRCAPHLVDEVITELRAADEVERVYHSTGTFDLTAIALFASAAELREFTVDRIGRIAGIVELQSELILGVSGSNSDGDVDVDVDRNVTAANVAVQ